MKLTKRQKEMLQQAAADRRGQAKGIAFVTAHTLQEKGLGTWWQSFEDDCFTINAKGREAAK